MASVQNMLLRAVRAGASLVLALSLVAALGCEGGKPELVAPETLVAPYDSTKGDVLWVVPPPVNESGTGAVDVLAVGDSLVNFITESQGLAAIPMNRTLAAMQSLRMPAVTSGADARRLAEALGADAVLVSVISSWDPYNPPKIGILAALYSRDAAAEAADMDARALQSAYTDAQQAARRRFTDKPVCVVAEQMDGANHAVQMNLKQFAAGRTKSQSALGWKSYLTSMDLYREFAAYWTVRRLLEEERLRLARLLPDSRGPEKPR